MDNSAAHLVGGIVGVLFGLGILAIVIVPIVMIIRKAGYSGWWVLIWLVPIANIIMLWVFAFSDWPNLARRPT